MANPRISVEITASEAKFREDLQKAVKTAEDSSKRIGVAFSGLKGLIQGAIGGLSFAALIAGFKAVTGAAESLGDLADATGSSVEDLSKLSNQAAVAGGNFEDFETVLLKFSTKLGTVHDETDAFSVAMQRLGVTSTDPAKALQQTILGLDKYANGATKAAYAQEIFGKAGSKFLATLTDMARLGDVAATVTTKQAEEAEKLNQALRRLSTESTGLRNAILTDIVPALNEMIRTMRDSITISGGLYEALRTLAQFNPFASAIENVDYFDKEIKKLEDTIAGVKASAGGFWAKLAPSSQDTSNLEENVKKLKQAREVAIAAQLRAVGGGPSNERVVDPNAKPKLPGLPKAGGTDTLKSLLDQQLKDLDNQIKAEQDALKDREHFLEASYQDSLISTRDYFDSRLAVASNATEKEIALYDKQIKALNDPAFNKTEKERIENKTKIADITAKVAKVENDVAVKNVDLFRDQAKAAKEFQATLEDVALAMQQISGDTVGAGLAVFDKANAEFKRKAEQLASSPDANESALGRKAVSDIRALRGVTETQLSLNKAQNDFRGTLEDVAIAEGKINLLQSTGAISEIQALSQRAALAKANIGLLEQEAAAYEALAAALPAGPAQEDAIRNAKRLRLEIDQLAASADALADKFNSAFGDAFANALVGFLDGTTNARQAIKALEKDVIHFLNQVAANEIKTALFGKGGAASGIGSLAAKLFGAISGGGDAGAEVFQFGRAIGGPVAANQPYIVGERGPELIIPKSAGTVIPNNKLGGSNVTLVQHINVMPGASRETARQAAFAAGLQAQRAMARNG